MPSPNSFAAVLAIWIFCSFSVRAETAFSSSSPVSASVDMAVPIYRSPSKTMRSVRMNSRISRKAISAERFSELERLLGDNRGKRLSSIATGGYFDAEPVAPPPSFSSATSASKRPQTSVGTIGSAWAAGTLGGGTAWSTAWHAVGGCSALRLRRVSDGVLLDARFVAGEPEADVAILRTAEQVPILDMAFSRNALVGDKLVIMGFPSGRASAFSAEAVTSYERAVPGGADRRLVLLERSHSSTTAFPVERYGGVSGGPAFDARGKVVGMVLRGDERANELHAVGAERTAALLDAVGARFFLSGERTDDRVSALAASADYRPFAAMRLAEGSVAEVGCLLSEDQDQASNP